MDSLQPHPPFRSFSTASSGSLNSSSTNITRIASGPLQAMNMNFNKASSPEDHMFFQCVSILREISKIEGMEEYLSLALAAAEDLVEQQSLSSSQQFNPDELLNNEHRGSISSNGFSMHSDLSSNSQLLLSSSSATINNNNGNNNGGSINLRNNNKLIPTFSVGQLPSTMKVDPVTQLSELFKLGAPLCLIFNSINSENQIPIHYEDIDRAKKKLIFDFLCGIKIHLNFDDDLLFPVTDVTSDDTHGLLRVIKVVKKLLNMKKESKSLSPLDPGSTIGLAEFELDPIPGLSELTITDDRSKVFKEIIETERKYVQDLELLFQYKEEVKEAELISSEQIHVLFPNLNDIIDFQRRFLNGLECNINVPTKFQRIGSVFIHAANGPFKAYEPWTIGQLSAIDLINKEASNLKKSSTLLDPGFELQSYIIKPIQRLCKYPLLLKELIKNSSGNSSNSFEPATYYNELLMAHQAMKEVANQVNEAQRRAENVGYLQSLVERVSNWRGFSLRDQGELLYHGVVGVKDAEYEKEYVAYLFERIIFFFIENNVNDSKDKSKDKKKRELLTTRKKSSSSVSSSTANLLESLNSAKDKSSLDLKGRVYISEIYNIFPSNSQGYTLLISWSGKKESGTFTLRYRTEESRNQWENCLRNLKTNEMNTQIHRKLRDSHASMATTDSYDVTDAYGNVSPHSIPQGTPINYPNGIQNGSSSGGNSNSNINDNISFRSSNGLFHRHHSLSSTLSMMRQTRSKSTSEHPSSSGSRISTNSNSGSFTTNNTYVGAGNDSSFLSQGSGSSSGISIELKLIYNKIEIANEISVPSTIQFSDLHLKISSTIASSDEINDDILVSKLKYKDEDGDFVMMDSNDDWNLAIDMLEELNDLRDNNSNERHLTIWVS